MQDEALYLYGDWQPAHDTVLSQFKVNIPANMTEIIA